MEWTNYENKSNKGILYLPEDYDADKEYPVLVQFYETHSGGLNVYHAPMLSSAMADVIYFVSNVANRYHCEYLNSRLPYQ